MVGSALLAALIAGCAAAPLPPARDLTASDTRRLAGSWEWTERFVSPARLGSGPIQVRIADGRMLVETATTTGALTLYEGTDRRVLKGEARDKTSGRPFPVSLSQRVRGSSTAAATAGPMVTLLVVQ